MKAIRHDITAVLCAATLFISTAAAAQGFAGLEAVTDSDFYYDGAPPAARVELGRLLFFDKILSGNGNISCATCHHTLTMTGDGLSLPVGEGGMGLGVTRALNDVPERVPRNAPAAFNLGAREFRTLFHDGRVQKDATQPSGYRSPAGDNLPGGLDNVLAAQAMFPVTSAAEMAGQAGENAQADFAAIGDLPGVWNEITQRLRAEPAYLPLFQAAFPGEVLVVDDIDYAFAANAIAAFEASAWRFTDSPFDRWLAGDGAALTPLEKRGMHLFYGRAGCSDCHAGVFQTDHGFHAVAMPQLGPGKGDNSPGYADGREDFGREQVTGDPADRFRFRTPTLRNVALTAPYGHAGAYDTLAAVLQHKLDAAASLESYDRSQATLPPDLDGIPPDLDAEDFVVMDDPLRRLAIAQANELPAQRLKERDVEALLAFLHALTDPAALDLRAQTPMTVPSGLPVFD